MKYRSEIDGLRAVAILPVVLFHAGLQVLSGGFVGVDVFFVLSGYLITSIIAAEMHEGRFTFGGFYERRIRRLLPAMVPVCLFVFGFAYRFYLPEDFTDVVNSLTAFTTFSANWFFMMTSGYFSAPADTKPLLHTWSLAIEEQFYLLFPPLLLLFITKARQYVLPVVLAAAFLSFAFGLYLAYINPEDAGYLNSFARFWELLLGSAIALWGKSPFNGSAAVGARWIGIGAIGAAVLWLDEGMAFPGYLALLPTLGTALVILAGGDGRDPILLALKSRPVVYIGRLSYSFYLWHWPVLVAVRYFFDSPSGWMLAAAVMIAFALAALSYHFVETPFRQRRVFASRLPIFGAAVATTTIIVAAVGIDRATEGMPFRFDQNLRTAAALSNHTNRLDCRRIEVSPGLTGCLYGAPRKFTEVDVIVWGDSLATGPRELFSEFAEKGGSLLLFSTPSCGPLLGTWKARDHSRSCAMKNASVAEFARSTRAKVILIAAWNEMATIYKGPFRIVTDSRSPKSEADVLEIFSSGLNATLTALAERDVTIVGQPPVYPIEVDRYVIKRQLLGLPLEKLVSVQRYKQTSTKVQSIIPVKREGLRYIDVTAQFCSATACRYHDDGIPLYHDRLHLNSTGAKILKPLVEPVLSVKSHV